MFAGSNYSVIELSSVFLFLCSSMSMIQLIVPLFDLKNLLKNVLEMKE